MDAQQVAEHARERLGVEIQAVTLHRPSTVLGRCPTLWSVMTEHGYFWLVEDASEVELFRAAYGRATHSHRVLSAAAAVERFLELHPEQRVTASPDTCRRCEAPVSRDRQVRAADPGLCARCGDAERHRLRYHSDPEYRARHLAASAARHAARQGGS